MTKEFTPILLGSDINVYGMARSFNEAYGIRVKALADVQLAATRYSKIVDVEQGSQGTSHFDCLW